MWTETIYGTDSKISKYGALSLFFTVHDDISLYSRVPIIFCQSYISELDKINKLVLQKLSISGRIVFKCIFRKLYRTA